MIPDAATDTVYISDVLSHRQPRVALALKTALGERLRVIPGTRDIWSRDYMPVQLADHRFVQFRYEPDYLNGHPHLRSADGARLLDLTKDCVRSDLVIDGGNVVRWNDAAILTNKIYRDNLAVQRPAVRDELRRLLEVERLIVIPKEPEDAIGHSDGMIRFVGEKTVLVNDYEAVDAGFGNRLAASLHKDGFEIIPFPYCPTDEPGPDPDIWPAVGVYINFLQISGMILCPTFGLPVDDQAMNTLSRFYPRHQIIPVPCIELAAGGGVLNCVTWNIKAEGRQQCR